jgi:hypothetical protein
MQWWKTVREWWRKRKRRKQGLICPMCGDHFVAELEAFWQHMMCDHDLNVELTLRRVTCVCGEHFPDGIWHTDHLGFLSPEEAESHKALFLLGGRMEHEPMEEWMKRFQQELREMQRR